MCLVAIIFMTYFEATFKMKKINSFIHTISILLFCIILSFLYAVLIDINPVLPLNIILWGTFCYIIYRAVYTQKWNNAYLKHVSLLLHALLITYIIYGVKSCYFVSYYNEMYLSGMADIFPIGYTDSILPTLLDPSIYLEKLDFMLGWNEISISFGSDRIVHFGSFLSNAIRLFEILGFFLSPYLFTQILAKD